jgi:signal recognition particle subunit SEC65
MSLQNLTTEQLEERWEELYPKFIEEVESLRVLLVAVEKKRKELSMIQEELKKRGVDVNDEKP